MIDTILFISSSQPVIDRGWDPRYVKSELSNLGFKFHDEFVNHEAEVFDLFKQKPNNLIVWPVCYTIGSNFNGRLLVDVLAELDIPFIGPSANFLKLNSKLNMKQELRAKFNTPDYRIVANDNINDIPFPAPYILKTEYSCDSKGIAVVENPAEAGQLFKSLAERYGQKIFAEKWERQTEYTVAYIPHAEQPLVAPLELTVMNEALIIDASVKVHNEFLRFDVPEQNIKIKIKEHVLKFANSFQVDGHFRLDILRNEDEELFFIDMNFLPGMNSTLTSFSYFPMCLQLNYGLDFKHTVCAILESVKKKFNCTFSPKIDETMKSIDIPWGK